MKVELIVSCSKYGFAHVINGEYDINLHIVTEKTIKESDAISIEKIIKGERFKIILETIDDKGENNG